MLSFKLADEELLVDVSIAADCSRRACRCDDAGERGANDSLACSDSCCRSLMLRPGIGIKWERIQN
jgi:hypothetical protein